MIRYCWDNIVVVWIYIGRYLPKEFGFNFFFNFFLIEHDIFVQFWAYLFDNFSIYEMAEGAAEADKSIFLEFILSFNLFFWLIIVPENPISYIRSFTIWDHY